MPDPAPSSTLRELRDRMARPRLVLALVGISVLLALAGPFGTAEAMPLAMRLPYWLVVAPMTYAIGFVVAQRLWPRLSGALPVPLAQGVASLVTGLAVGLAVLAFNALVFGPPDSLSDALFPDLATFVAVAIVVTLLLDLLAQATAGRETGGPDAAATGAPLLDRLPLDKRGALVSLSVEDHYVRVRTNLGEEMLLMRLTDAIREVGDTPGLRVHRSHWVATRQVAAAMRRGDGAVLTLATGDDIPVSRSHMTAVRRAGLLPG